MRFAPSPGWSSKSALYFLTAFTAAAALLLFTLLANAGSTDAQQSATATRTPTASGPTFPPVPPKRTPPLGNLDSMLSQLAARVQGGYSTAHDAASQVPIHSDDSVAVTFYFNGDTAPLLAFLRANGGDPRNIGEDYVEAYVPVALLAEASEQPNVVRVQAIVPPQPARGSVTSQGVTTHAANAWHTAGYTGDGVKVGVIDGGFDGFIALMGSELPANVTARCYTDIGVFTSNIADCEPYGSHGTAVSETLLDIAPNATLYITNPVISVGDLRSAVDWLVSQDVDVINHSTSWNWGGPGDGTSPYSNSPLKSVDAAVSGGIMFANSAGNEAKATWFGAFSNPDFDGWLNFTDSAELNRVELEAGKRFMAQLRWSGSWDAASRDLDLYLYHESDLSNPIASSINYQLGEEGDIPYERVIYTPETSGIYYIAVWHAAGNVPSWVQLQSFTSQDLQFYTETGSIGNPAESANPGMLAVGAAHYWDVNTIASYSSRGPTPDGRVKPDIVGADCAEVSSYPERIRPNGQRCWFLGTSQSSPHIAGLAALVKQRFPEYTPAQIANYLKSNAEPRGAVPNNNWGYGFANLPNPTNSETPLEPSPTPTGTARTASPTPTATSTTVPTPVNGDIEGRVSALEDLIRRLESLMMAFDSRLAALEGGTTAPTPTSTSSPTPTRVPGATSFSSISAGWNHTCGLEDSAAVCWGDNGYGQDSPPAGETFVSIGAGGWHTCGLREDGTAVCWGAKTYGQSLPPSGETFVSLSVGGEHTCGLRENGSVVCWGESFEGITSTPLGETFASISAGWSHTCGLRENGTAVCWGHKDIYNHPPPPGETFASISVGFFYTCGLRVDGSAVCWGDNEDGQSPPPSGETFAFLSAGWLNHICGLREDGTAVCWGDNEHGQSTPPLGERFTSISAGWDHTCGLREDGTAVCWGDNEYGQLTPP